MSKYLISFILGLIFFVACKNSPSTNALLSVKGRFIKMIKVNDGTFKLLLKLKNDSLVGFKTTMTPDDPAIELFKNGEMEIEVIYEEYKNPLTNTEEKIAQSIYPIYNLSR